MGGEAWVVVRNAGPLPTAEIAVVLDKTKTVEENVYSNAAHACQVSVEFRGMKVYCSSRPNQTMEYEEWQGTQEPGTLEDPWICDLIRADRPGGPGGYGSASDADVLG